MCQRLGFFVVFIGCSSVTAHAQQPVIVVNESVRLETKNRIASIAISESTEIIAIARGRKKPIEIWSVSEQKLKCLIDGGTTGKPSTMQFTKNDQMLTAISSRGVGEEREGSVCIWNSVTGVLKAHKKLIAGAEGRIAAFSRDGRIVIMSPTIEAAKTLFVWDWTADKKLTIDADEIFAYSAYICPQNKTIVTLHPKSVRIWDYPSGKLRHKIALDRANVWNGDFTVGFSADGKRFHFRYPRLSVDVWDAYTGKSVLDGPFPPVTPLRFLLFPDGKHLLADSGKIAKDQGLDVWNIEKRVRVLHLRGARCESFQDDLVISNDGRRVAHSSSKGIVSIWDLPKLQP